MKKLPLCSVFIILIACNLVSCKDDGQISLVITEPKFVFKNVFDSTQSRRDNIGNPSALPANYGAQSSRSNKKSAHYIDLSPGSYTLLGGGKVVCYNRKTNPGGSTALEFSKLYPSGNGQQFFLSPSVSSHQKFKNGCAFRLHTKIMISISGTRLAV